MGDKRKISCVLITGISGSGASYLAEHILENHPQVQVHGISRWHSTSKGENVKDINDKITIHEADLLDLASIFWVLEKVRPDVIFHLAAYANVRASFITPYTCLNNNIMGTSNLFEAVREVKLDPIIKLCSTSEVYGNVGPEDVPLKESAPFRPVSPYAVSKATQDLLGFSYFVSYGLRIIRTRMFGYINPRRSDLFASAFASQIARIERGLQKELRHGNLESVRTLIDVRDAAAAYWEAVMHCRYGEAYNIGGTSPVKVGDILKRLIAISHKPIPTRLDPGLMRPADVTLQIPCVDKFISQTGWQPKYTLDKSLEFLLAHYRQEVDKIIKAKKNENGEYGSSISKARG